MAPTQADLEAQKAQADIDNDVVDEIILSSGRKVGIGWMMNPTQDKLDTLYVEYELTKKKIKDDDNDAVSKGNKATRQYFAKCVAAILINNYIGIRLLWWLKWRIIYYMWNISGDDYLRIICEAKKKATEQQYSLAMVLLMSSVDMWTTMTKKEAEEYHQELELAREHQSLKNSQN